MQLLAGDGMVGRIGEELDVVAGSMAVSSGGAIEMVGGTASLSTEGGMSGYAGGAVDVGASSMSARSLGSASASVGGTASLAATSASVSTSGSGSATFGAGVSVSAGSVQMESVDGIVGVGKTVDVTGRDGVSVGSIGAGIELDRDGLTCLLYTSDAADE